MKTLKYFFYVVVVACFFHSLGASGDWLDVDRVPQSLSRTASQVATIQAKRARYLLGNTASIRAQLLTDAASAEIDIPLPDGSMETYRLQQYAFAEPAFMDAHPELRAFKGVDVNNAANTGYFDITPNGLRAMFRHADSTILIDPDEQEGADRYIVYYEKDAISSVAGMQEIIGKSTSSRNYSFASHLLATGGSSDNNLRTYRLALAATGEYTEYFGGVSAARAEILTIVNRLNAIYQRDLGIRFQLVSATDSLIYPEAEADPYIKLASPLNSASIDQLVQDNVDNLNAVLGVDGYDIGHLLDRNLDNLNIGRAGVLGPDGGDIGAVGSVCTPNKGLGASSFSAPESDISSVILLAHEIGHQFGADHSFAGVAGSCFLARSPVHAYEVNSGSTIMGYAGLCGSENLQAQSDAYFHAHSIEEVTAFVRSANTCGQLSPMQNVDTLLPNNVPTVDAGFDYIIPTNTAFTLVGAAVDADVDDVLNYTWEQYDPGVAGRRFLVDDGIGPIFRSFEPVSEPFRTFPRFTDVLRNELSIGEIYPATTRDLNFRLTARDGNGGTAFDDAVVSVVNTGEAFAVTAPVLGDFWLSSVPATVEWDVAGTDAPPINCATVDIMLSPSNADAGSNAFSIMLAAAVANDGREVVTVPSLDTSTARLMVKCTDNVFFALNSGAFELVQTEVVVAALEGSQSVIEGTDIVLSVVLTAAPSVASRLPLVLANIDTSAVDYGPVVFDNGVTLAGDILTIPAGISRFELTLPTIDDSLVETDEALDIRVGDASVRVVINNDDIVPASTSSSGGSGGGSFSVVEAIALLGLVLFLICNRYRRRYNGF